MLGGEVPLLQKKKKNKEFFKKWIFSMTILGVSPWSPCPIDGDMTSPTGMHMQAGFLHAHSGRSYSMPFLSI